MPESHSGAASLLALSPLRAVLRLAAPTTLVMLIAASSNVLYTYYVSRLGADAIAAVALVFPLVLLAITAMGGGIGAGASSAIARALGAGDRHRAGWLAEHALLLAIAAGVAFAIAIVLWGRALFALMGGRGVVLDLATGFADIVFGGAVVQF
ncbi:MAG TPA: MATE family efflux transporter, partial [Terriglobales bacterium]|nr:MATE family efflux transporter [Terriglobales bacterium]